MPLLSRGAEAAARRRREGVSSPHETIDAPPAGFGRRAEAAAGRWPALFPVCAYSGCSTGWLHLWRRRSAPVMEGGWSCSPACTRALVETALRREMGARLAAPEMHRHRVPLGLSMLEQGWISAEVLRCAVAAQRASGSRRIGHWLRSQGVSERLIARALGVQWSCPVFSIDSHSPEPLTALVPRLFVDAFGALPLRVAAGRILYLGFEDRLDPALALVIERMTDLRVESGLVEESNFRRAHARALDAHYPAVELVEASTETALAGAMAKAIERACPVESKLARVHDCLWLRMWLRPQRGAVPAPGEVADLIGSVRGH